MKLSSREVYDRLVNEDRILEQEGQISFNFGDVGIVVKQRDTVGNILQEWLQGWLDSRNIDYALSENSQMPPDFFLDPADKTKNLLEVKAYNYNASPGFDIADFRMYETEIIDKPYMLDVDYLIFGYDMDDTGIVTIKNLWIKKVWEITSSSEKWPMKLQVKKNVVHKIRPCNWDSASTHYKTFARLEDFISAIEETVYQNPDTRKESSTWKYKFLKSYEEFYGVRLSIPRWDDIRDEYCPK